MEPPHTPRRDATYELHGDAIEDPYMWLEDGDDETVGEWVDTQNEYADAVLSESDAREALRPRLAELARTVEYEPIKPTDGGFFQRVRHPEDDHAVLTYRETLGEERRRLLDPNEWSDDGSVSMNWYAPSPDGAYVAYGVDEGGRENYDVHVLDVESGEDVEVLASMGRANLLQGAWKGEGFYYVTTGAADAGGQLDKEFRYHALGTDPDADLVVREEFADEVWPLAVADEDGDHVVVALGTWDRADLYALDHAEVLAAHDGGDAVELTPLIEGEDAKFDPEVAGDDLYVRTTHGAPNYRVARLDLSGGPPADGADALETVVPEDDDAIVESIAVTDSRLFVQRNRDVVAELAVHDRDGGHLADVDLPGTGSLSEPQAHAGADALFVTYQSFDHPASACRVAAGGTGDEGTGGTGGQDTGGAGGTGGGGTGRTGGADRSLDPSFEVIDRPGVAVRADLAVDQEWFESTDGTEVPLFVVRREGVERDGSNPAVLYGYGGFDISLGPEFRQYVVPFLEDGGVFAVANLRGGGEFGDEWHHAARRETKQRTFDDAAAAAEHLIDRGWTAPDRLAIRGGSNGGLTVGATITQRPELFAAALSRVPLLDMLRFHTSLLGASWTGEYGDPDDPDDYEYLGEYSPYHHVERSEYPDVLFTTAEGDTRVDPFHARKMTARMQRRAVDTTVLLKTYGATGHGVGKPVSQVVDEQVDQWGFLYDRLGVERED